MALLWHYHGMTMYDHGITMDDHGIAMHYLGTSMVCSRFAIVRCLVQTPQSCHGNAVAGLAAIRWRFHVA